jgi:hypothetical protein
MEFDGKVVAPRASRLSHKETPRLAHMIRHTSWRAPPHPADPSFGRAEDIRIMGMIKVII